jgi:hypothetical protein
MKLPENLSKETINKKVDKSIDKQSSITTNRASNYKDLGEKLANHDAVVIEIKVKLQKFYHGHILQLVMLKGF